MRLLIVQGKFVTFRRQARDDPSSRARRNPTYRAYQLRLRILPPSARESCLCTENVSIVANRTVSGHVTFSFGEEEGDDNEVDGVQTDENKVVLPADIGDGQIGNLESGGRA